jgi:hypothetical protein
MLQIGVIPAVTESIDLFSTKENLKLVLASNSNNLLSSLLLNSLGILKIAEKIILLFSIAASVYPASPGAIPSTIPEASSTVNTTNSLI